MKINNKRALSPTKAQSGKNKENDRRQINWRLIGLRLAAIFLVIVFLASECSMLLPLE
jgi:hypothetical protein